MNKLYATISKINTLENQSNTSVFIENYLAHFFCFYDKLIIFDFYN